MGVISSILVAIFILFGSRMARADPPEGCEEIMLPMCRGEVPYNYTQLGRGQTQAQIYRWENNDIDL